MRRFIVALFTLLLLILTGCGMTQNADRESNVLSRKTVYYSKISAKDCYLCGGGIENRIPSYWGQNNVALISLNTFEIKPLEINRYDINGKLVEEYAGYVSFGGNDSIDGGFSACLMIEHDRGFATGSVDFFNDKTLSVRDRIGQAESAMLEQAEYVIYNSAKEPELVQRIQRKIDKYKQLKVFDIGQNPRIRDAMRIE